MFIDKTQHHKLLNMNIKYYVLSRPHCLTHKEKKEKHIFASLPTSNVSLKIVILTFKFAKYIYANKAKKYYNIFKICSF